ncbi:MAG: hypothetical protein AAGD34_14990 [Pseudomonadota bacterium]
MSDPLAPLRTALDRAAQTGSPLAFWWRDDDACHPGPRLDALFAMANHHGAPLALAVIPDQVSDAVLARCERDGVAVLQHGLSHTNHQTTGKAAELGNARPLDAVLADCAKGRERLAASPAFLPVMVPPWNRMRADLATPLAKAGYSGVSLFAGPQHTGPLRRVDTHIDPIAWRTDRDCLNDAALADAMQSALALPNPGALGLLTHHAVHTDRVWAFVDAFAGLIASHPGAVWAGAGDLFKGPS